MSGTQRNSLHQIVQQNDQTSASAKETNRHFARIKIFVSGRGSSACLEKSASSYLSGLTAPLEEFAQYRHTSLLFSPHLLTSTSSKWVSLFVVNLSHSVTPHDTV